MSKVDELRKKYTDNPPDGYSRKDIYKMSDDELLDMDYFLNETLEDIFGIPSSNSCVLESVQFKCKNCGCLEYIPKNIVDSLDAQFGTPDFPPTFSCEKCYTGTMFPVNYKSPRGIIYKFNNQSTTIYFHLLVYGYSLCFCNFLILKKSKIIM